MLRPSIIALSLFVAVSLTGCSSSYRRMYSPKRSYFKPEKEQPKAAELLPPVAPAGGAAPGAGAPPAATPPPAAPAAPAIPGL